MPTGQGRTLLRCGLCVREDRPWGVQPATVAMADVREKTPRPLPAPPAKVNRVSTGSRTTKSTELSQAVTWDSLPWGQPETSDTCQARNLPLVPTSGLGLGDGAFHQSSGKGQVFIRVETVRKDEPYKGWRTPAEVSVTRWTRLGAAV